VKPGYSGVISARRRARPRLLVLMRSRVTIVTCGTRPPSANVLLRTVPE
jgi:hypothetical protein